MAIDGTIRIHRSIGGTGAAFRVSFVPYDTDGETTAAVRSRSRQIIGATKGKSR